MRGKGRLTAGIAVFAALLVLPASAGAVTRLAQQGGSDFDLTCLSTPCSLEHAVQVALPLDDVRVAPGDYSLETTLDVPIAVSVHGTQGQPRPLIHNSSASPVVTANQDGVVLRHLTIRQDGGNGSALQAVLPAAGVVTLDDLFLHAHAAESTAAEIGLGARLTNSVAWADTGPGTAISVASGGATIQNVTAYGTAGGASGSGIKLADSTSVTVTNTIARVLGGTGEGDLAGGGGGTFNVSNSNFATAPTVVGGGNSSAAPLLADPTGGDFHELSGSPTINAGSPTGLLNLYDFDGEARVLGGIPDVGADEFVPPPPQLIGGGGGGTPDAGGDVTPPTNLPQFTALSLPASITVGQPVRLQASGTDANDAVNSIAIDFDDGPGYFAESACRLRPPDPAFTGNRASNFSVPYTFSTPGIHTVEVTLTSGGCGKSQQATTQSIQVVVGEAKTRVARVRAREAQQIAFAAAGCKSADKLPTRRNRKRIERSTLCLLNQVRRQNGLKGFRRNKKLRRAGALHNKWMLKTLVFAHQVPGEPPLYKRFRKVKYRGGGGENLGVGAGMPYATPRSMVQAWMNSPVHRANILERAFHTIGIAIAAKKPLQPPTPGATYTTEFGTTKR